MYRVLLISIILSIPFLCRCSTIEPDNDIKDELLSVQQEAGLYSDFQIHLSSNHGLGADGRSVFSLGSYCTEWLQGEGVYKILKPTRESSYKIAYSSDGKEGTKVISFKDCQNTYIVVPPSMPYFRMEFESSRIEIKKVKDFAADLVDIREFGAKGDGITDDTYAIQDALDYVSYGKGGSVYIPNGTFLLSTLQEFDNQRANLIIPYNRNNTPYLSDYSSDNTYYANSRVCYGGEMYFCLSDGTSGEWNPSKWEKFGTQYSKTRVNIIGNGRAVPYKSFIESYNSLVAALHQGSFFLSKSTCDFNDGTEAPSSVVACGYSTSASYSMNKNIVLAIKGLTIKTDNSNGYSRLSGLNMSHCQCLYLDDVSVYSAERIQEVFDGSIGHLHESGHFSSGIMMPATFCDPTTYAHNVSVSGSFTIGMMIGDCQSIEDSWVGLCKYGFVQCQAGHPSVVGGHVFCFNSNTAIASVGGVLLDSLHEDWETVKLFGVYSPLSGYMFVNQISVEPAAGMNPSPFNMENIVYDPSNTLRGRICYINADEPSKPLHVVGAKNIEIVNLGK